MTNAEGLCNPLPQYSKSRALIGQTSQGPKTPRLAARFRQLSSPYPSTHHADCIFNLSYRLLLVVTLHRELRPMSTARLNRCLRLLSPSKVSASSYLGR